MKKHFYYSFLLCFVFTSSFSQIIQSTGDVLITIRYQNRQKPQVDVYLLVEKYTTWFANPSAFKFGSKFLNVGNSSYGGHNIVPLFSDVCTGSGMMDVVLLKDVPRTSEWAQVPTMLIET